MPHAKQHSTKRYHGPLTLEDFDLERCTVQIVSVERGDDIPSKGYVLAVAYAWPDGPGPNAQHLVDCWNAIEASDINNPAALPPLFNALPQLIATLRLYTVQHHLDLPAFRDVYNAYTACCRLIDTEEEV